MHFKVVGKLLFPKRRKENTQRDSCFPALNSISQPGQASAAIAATDAADVDVAIGPSSFRSGQLLQRNYRKVFCLLHN